MSEGKPGTEGSGEGSNAGNGEGANAGEGTKGSGTEETVSKEKYEALKSELEETRGKANKNFATQRTLESEVKELKEKLAGANSKGSEGGNPDNDEIKTLKKSFDSQLSESNEKIAKLEAEKRDLTVASRVKDAAKKAGLLESAVEDFWGLEGNKFDVSESGDLVLKDDPYRKPDEFIAQWAEARPYAVASQRKAGSGTVQKGDTGQSGMTRENFEKLSQGERHQFMNENPKAYTALYVKEKSS